MRQLLKYIRLTNIKEATDLDTLYKATVVSMIFSVAAMSLFDSVIRLYFLYGMLLFMSYFFSQPKTK